MLNNRYVSFGLVTAIFLVMVAFLGLLWLKWDRIEPPSDDVLEINLPVIDWAHYLDLSKRPDSSNLESEF